MQRVAFTIVLNGMPFIEKQYDIIPKVFDKWYIVEGVVFPKCDTSWCSTISNKFYNDDKLSIDGTTEFLDSIKSDNIIVIRKNDFWNGKLEMCNSFMADLTNTTLMQFDVDEIWSVDKLQSVLSYAEDNDYFDAMLFKCNYYMGPNLKIISENGYADNSYEWCRLWKIRDRTEWISHEPPIVRGCKRLLTKQYTKSNGWIFDHYAYVLESQLEFKENFYNYSNALKEWKRLQLHGNYPCKAKDFLSWVGDNTILNTI